MILMIMTENDNIKNENVNNIFELIQKGDDKTVKNLITNNVVSINCLDENGLSPIDQAAFKGNEELVEWLLANKANPHNKANKDGYTSLMFAALSGNSKVCELLLEAGVNSEALNILGKSASEIAAFTGQHECVSTINSYITYGCVDKILHPNGPKSSEIYPPVLVKFIHELVKGNEIHPVRIIFKIVNNIIIKQYPKKILWVIDRLFERQLRFKSSNEMMSLKLWIIYFPLNEVMKFVKKCENENKDDEENFDTEKILLSFAKRITEIKKGSIVKEYEEIILRNTIQAFPYKQSLLHHTISRALGRIKNGTRSSVYTTIIQGLYGEQLLMNSKICETCGFIGSKLRCQRCKTTYCSQDCQKFDWSSHKDCCKTLAQLYKQEEVLPIEELENLNLQKN
ncbi:Ankyrin repeat and Zinc finger, MYND-type domain and Ankyrin repeat-containing domain-containing protein [Strongyloides ratti]|uniref:Ankyrin repeat and Zinc finger, MYND-type domain and Ankyrin repeat-containing domain-containing protein n=2 Tax=Strongyloides ratti TaxID=34506 RepID=A0A1P6CWA2_STRRB|nr:Ankyrin repeat and Zinc finger, MYND-type domain and Ankyrin repeat-containing domain-containing protein [Strongyloides ratti]CEF65644.1 Ankyrin repeat and Zinc finger, MYND-type domain and Ankyrin repeat-containing domain-containing protein [Strongyloides ratti]